MSIHLTVPPLHRGPRRRATAVSAAACALFASAGVLITGGCGGSSSSINYQTTTVTTTINWPARSRDINAPSSALSCIISLQSGNTTTGGSVDFPAINRDTTITGPYSQTWTSPTAVRTGSNKINIRFYPQPNGDGQYVADLTKAIDISSSNTDLGTFTVSSLVASVKVNAGQTVNFGNTGSVAFSAYDSSGAQLPNLSPGSAFFATTIPGGATVTTGGAMTGGTTPTTGIQLGPTTVTATVDGVTSAPVAVSSIVGTSSLTTTADGLGYRDTVAGSGATAKAGDTATIDFQLYRSTDGNLDSGNYTTPSAADGSAGSFPFTIGAANIIPGFSEAVTGMAVGGTRIVVVPPALGYGSNPVRDDNGNIVIPANSTLIFIIRLTALN